MKKLNLLITLMLFTFSLTVVQALEPVKTGSQLENSVALSNRRSALRCLTLAQDSAGIKNWNGAISQASLGLAYDDSISDLWYILAVAENSKGSVKAEVLPLVKNALEKENWVNYNRDGARILYADLLCDTGSFSQVEEILDSRPRVYSADADYIRAKSYYRTNTPESIRKAREMIDSARKIYPDDTRFPMLFFYMESSQSQNETVNRMKSYFIKQIAQYVEAAPDKDAELEIYAASFAEGMDRTHLLQSFEARDLRHPLYARIAMEDGILSQREALQYIVSFADSGIDFDILLDFIMELSEPAVIQEAADYFTAYSGVIYQDTDGDGIYNMYVKYSRGRPQTVGYDQNQDGLQNWTVLCDFGIPVAGHMGDYRMEFTWSEFPYLKNCIFKDKNGNEEFSFDLVNESFAWAPFTISPQYEISEVINKDFFFPQLTVQGEELTSERLVKNTRGFSTPGRERQNARIYYVTLDGKLQYARYTENGRMYAQATFKDDLPVLRVVDFDNDGIFETTEFYSVDETRTMVHSLDDERSILTNIYGRPSNAAPFYLRLIQIDRDLDTVPDFTEEYIEGKGKISSWDNDNDGKWEVRYVRYGQSFDAEGNEEAVKEDAMFYQPQTGKLVTITSLNGIPVSVKCGQETLSVTKDPYYSLYWVGNAGNTAMAKKAWQTAAKMEQGLSTIIMSDDKKSRMLVVKIGDKIFGNIIQ